MSNRLILLQCRSHEILTHGGPRKLRNFLLIINAVAVAVFSDRSSDSNYYEDDHLDRYINLQIEVFEAALGTKVERHTLDYPVMDARNEFYSAFRKPDQSVHSRTYPAPV